MKYINQPKDTFLATTVVTPTNLMKGVELSEPNALTLRTYAHHLIRQPRKAAATGIMQRT